MNQSADARLRGSAKFRHKSSTAIVRVVARESDFLEADLEHVSRVSPFYIYGPRQDVTAGPAQRTGILRDDIAQPLRNVSGLYSKALESGRCIREHRLDLDDVARFHTKRRFRL